LFESSFYLSFVAFFIVLTPLIFVHEFGHYYAAIKSGVKVETFSIGFGPELLGFNDNKNTRWKFSLIPLGGYVKMKGELININDNSNKNSLEKDSFFKSKFVVKIYNCKFWASCKLTSWPVVDYEFVCFKWQVYFIYNNK